MLNDPDSCQPPNVSPELKRKVYMGHEGVHVMSSIQMGTFLWPTHQDTFYTLLLRKWNNCKNRLSMDLPAFILTPHPYVFSFSPQNMLCHFSFHILQMFVTNRIQSMCLLMSCKAIHDLTSGYLSLFFYGCFQHSFPNNLLQSCYPWYMASVLWLRGTGIAVVFVTKWKALSTESPGAFLQHSGFCSNVTC